MYIDLHNHTILCRHAEGSMREYIEKAIEKGMDIFGFSEHAPMNFDEEYRLSFDEMQLYESGVRELAQKYEESIDIRLGYEVDWLPGYMDERVLNADVDYLIGSVHFIEGWGFDNPEFIGRYESEDIDELWRKYFAEIEKMVGSGLFDIVAHFDLIKVFRFLPQADIPGYAEASLDAIAAREMVLELNAAGLRKPIGELYPSIELLKMAYERDIPITFASDAHSPEQVGFAMREVVEAAKSVGYSQLCAFKNRKMEAYSL